MELVWVRVRVEEECFWVNLREDNKVFESKMAVSESKMAEFKMAAIIKLSQNEQVKLFFCAKWLNPRWQNSRWLPSSIWVRMHEWSFFVQMAEYKMAEFKMAAIIKLSQNEWFESDRIRLSQSFVQHGWIQDGRIQDGCHHQVSQIELVWVRVRVEEECFWVNLRENNKCLNPRWLCLNPTWQSSRWLPSSSWVRMNEFESDWTSLSQSFVQNGWIQDGRIQDGKIQDGCHH